jgi:4-amino-4-deoxy-L-arabinose transferase-like glycosyltransferase
MTNDKRLIVICSLLLCSFVLRLAPLGRYVTPDEPVWVYRSIRFADALAARDWAAVPSTGHPGVTTMWLGAAGVMARRLLNSADSTHHLEWIRRLAWLAPENGAAFRHLAYFLPFGRVAVALATSLALLAVYILLVRLFNRQTALLTAGLLAFEPFLVGHSGLLHTDALLTTCSFLSILCLTITTRNSRRAWAWSLASGAMGGLALLTKSLAVFLPPFTCLVLGSAWLIGKLRLWKALGLALLWTLSCAALFTALYPAMWANPWQTLQDMFGAPAYQSTTALMPTFFWGQTTLYPGPAFYVAALLIRLGPIVLVGALLSLHLLTKEKSLRPELSWLWLFVAGYILLLTLSIKKYDRYLLPVFPPLALAAALGWEHLDIKTTRPEVWKPRLLVVLQLALLLPFATHPLTSFNLLLGGPWVGARVISADWGEGMGAAARRLNQQSNADQLTVAALSVPSFAPLFAGRTVPLDQTSLADYIVTTAIHTNTAPFEQAAYLAAHAGPDDLILLDAETPLLYRYTGPGTITAVTDLPDPATVAARLAELSAGRSRLWLIADPSASPITAAHLRQGLENIATPVSVTVVASATIRQYTDPNFPIPNPQSPISTFGDYLTLVDTLLPAEPVRTAFSIFVRWRTLTSVHTDLRASLYLRDTAGHLWSEVGELVLNSLTFPTSAWTPGEWADNTLKLKLPEHIPPGDYVVQLTVTDSAGAQLGAWDADGRFQGVRVHLGRVTLTPPAEPAGRAPCTEGHSLVAGPLWVCAPDLPPQAVPSGGTFVAALVWSAADPPDVDYRVRWRLLDVAGASPAAMEYVAALSPYPTSQWRTGDSFKSYYSLQIAPTLPAAAYTLSFNVLTPDDGALWAEDAPLTTVEVLPRDRLFELPGDITHPLDLWLGDAVRVRGFDATPLPTPGKPFRPGDALGLTLYWQAAGPTDIDYTVFVHLVGPDGRPHGQVDQLPAEGTAPTTSWATDQVIIDEITLSVADDAPEGAYYIAVGMYDAASGGRLPLSDASRQPLAADQIILPLEIAVAGGSR